MRNIFDIIFNVPDNPDYCTECKRINSKPFKGYDTIIEYCKRHSTIELAIIKYNRLLKESKITKYGKDYLKG